MLVAAAFACGGGGSATGTEPEPQPQPQPITAWDIATRGIPHFVSTNYIDLSMIAAVSKFRSSVGHDYSDAFETCRSMKHYFTPKASVAWNTVPVYSPVTGTVLEVRDEVPLGFKVTIRPDAYPAFRLSIFHVSFPAGQSLTSSARVTAGQQLGTHLGSQTTSDVAVSVNEGITATTLVSWFDVMTDGLFQAYAARGATTRRDFIITRAERDADPLTCAGSTFLTRGTLASQFNLN